MHSLTLTEYRRNVEYITNVCAITGWLLTFDRMQEIFHSMLVQTQSFFVVLCTVFFCCLCNNVNGFLKVNITVIHCTMCTLHCCSIGGWSKQSIHRHSHSFQTLPTPHGLWLQAPTAVVPGKVRGQKARSHELQCCQVWLLQLQRLITTDNYTSTAGDKH